MYRYEDQHVRDLKLQAMQLEDHLRSLEETTPDEEIEWTLFRLVSIYMEIDALTGGHGIMAAKGYVDKLREQVQRSAKHEDGPHRRVSPRLPRDAQRELRN